MANFRVFVEKQAKFNIEAQQLLADFRQSLSLNRLTSLRVLNLYDLFNISLEEFSQAQNIVFAEAPVDNLYTDIDLSGKLCFAVEPLPGQYNQRSDSAIQALNLLSISNPHLNLTTGKLLIFDGINNEELELIKKYYINPLETREKDLQKLIFETPEPTHTAVPLFSEFNQFNIMQLADFRQQQSLAMTLDDLICIQDYFINEEKRAPSETEIKVLDTYWSDHCRHTTFETHLNKINFTTGKYQQLFQQAFEKYQHSRDIVYGAKAQDRAITLMDLATICGKQLRKENALTDVEFSDEINACSLFVDIEVDGKLEQWSLQFKNETHNHPTEIEPYGGASTCVGGAIRDPLSGRSYVYQALRISGAANPLGNVEETLAGKLAQKKITTQAAQGFSAYGNQIGLATTLVREIYHPGYKAKRMEVGVVVAAAPYANIRREQPKAGDLIILLGGRTGRDGCGGATGSSKEHDVNSAAICGAEVQKGNPVVERKIQRLFRNPQVTRLIKKCNDFGAGGVSVAIGELADGVKINLDKVPTKYQGLTGTELAISESQERMAVVISHTDSDLFIRLAEEENLEAVVVAEVTADARMIMTWQSQIIVDLARTFLNTNGAKSFAEVTIANPSQETFFDSKYPNGSFSYKLQQSLADLNNCAQTGMVDMFDATIGAGTVLMPYGGKYQLTPSQVSVQKFPVLKGTTDAASIASFGFDPYLSSSSPFHGAYYAVVESVAKIVAAGSDYRQIKFSFQEYFEKLGADNLKWGKPFSALLGAYQAQQEFSLAAIGGKDSMSGSFNDLHVPPALISFAVAPTLASIIISPEFKTANNYIYAYFPDYKDDNTIEFATLLAAYKQINQLIANGVINAASSIGFGGIADNIAKMAFGNKVGAELLANHKYDLFTAYYGGIIFTSTTQLANSDFCLIGTTNESQQISYQEEKLNLNDLISVWQNKLAPVFPLKVSVENDSLTFASKIAQPSINTMKVRSGSKFAKPKVIIPVFPGSNCEYDSIRAFTLAGAQADSLIFNNLSIANIQESISSLAAEIAHSQILMLPGGFSAGDEPDGSAKFITAILSNQQIKDAVHGLLARDGLILGICNGFQALIKSGLLPDGEIKALSANSPTLTYNVIGRHISRLTATKITNNTSPWLNSFQKDEIKHIAMSHGEGRFVVTKEVAEKLFANGQVACQYVDLAGNPTLDGEFNPNGSDYAIEAITSLDGRILGKMGHSERKGNNLYKNIIGDKTQDIFNNGVNYFK